MAGISPAKQLNAFIAKFEPKFAAEVKKVLAVMRRSLKGAQELVYAITTPSASARPSGPATSSFPSPSTLAGSASSSAAQR
jgi:hypothetical protein